jgi:hypothetical protein
VPQAFGSARHLLETQMAEAGLSRRRFRVPCRPPSFREATALKVLLGHVAEVEERAEDVILAATVRIGEEIKKIPKAGGPGRGKRSARSGTSFLWAVKPPDSAAHAAPV